MDGFEFINQPDFDRERYGAVQDIMRNPQRHDWSLVRVANKAYNEGYKQALRDWSVGFIGKEWVGCSRTSIKEIIKEVDNIDGKEG